MSVDIDTMEAGEEVDRLIANVMGDSPELLWSCVNPDGKEYEFTDKEFNSRKNVEERLRWYLERHPTSELKNWHIGQYPFYKKYSTDIAVAWPIWNHIRDSGKWCCLEILSDFNYTYTIKLTPFTNGKFHEPTVIVDCGDEDLSMAICRMALKVKQNESSV